jgi:hypothetical protein
MKTRALLSLVVASAFAFDASPARADERAECAKSYEQTQRLRQESNMVRAIEDADRCAQASCPDLLRNECATWAKELRASVARIVIHVRGGDGCAAVEPAIVPSPRARRDGDGWIVDPGVQELTVSDPSSARTKKVQLDLRPGERREIDVDFAESNATCTKPTAPSPADGGGASRRIPPVSVGLASVGAGFIVLGGALGIIGAGKRDDLERCKPCSQDRLDAVKPYFVIGDTVAAIGLVSIGAAIAVYFAVQSAPPPKAQRAGGVIRPTPSGFALSF